MAKTIIVLEEGDIEVQRLGDRTRIICQNDIEVIFTKEAIDELLKNVHSLYNRKSFQQNDMEELYKLADRISGKVLSRDEVAKELSFLLENLIIRKDF